MRRLLLIVALLAASLGAICIAPAGASAANCTFGGNISYADTSVPQPIIYYAASIYNCSDVSAVRWVYHPAGNPTVGWYDYAAGAYASGFIGNGTSHLGGSDVDRTVVSTCTGSNICLSYIMTSPVWWSGACRIVRGHWYAQIKRAATGTWGSVFTIDNPSNSLCF